MGRAHALAGIRLDALAARVGLTIGGDPVHTKGKFGELVERALGAIGGSDAQHDFPLLRVELKTVPMNAHNRTPLESTYVCRIQLSDADSAEWQTSWVRDKLSRVLFVPIENAEAPWPEREVGAPVLYSPSPDEERVLRADFDDAMGLIGAGRVEELTAHVGQWMQVRPKAAHGGVRTSVLGSEGERIDTIPRGFYLRARFVGGILAGRVPLP